MLRMTTRRKRFFAADVQFLPTILLFPCRLRWRIQFTRMLVYFNMLLTLLLMWIIMELILILTKVIITKTAVTFQLSYTAKQSLITMVFIWRPPERQTYRQIDWLTDRKIGRQAGILYKINPLPGSIFTYYDYQPIAVAALLLVFHCLWHPCSSDHNQSYWHSSDIHRLVSLSLCLSVHLYVCPSVCPSVCLSICLSVCVSRTHVCL